jgi:hypothetical protein
MLSRRGFVTCLSGLVAAPFVAKAELLMPVRLPPVPLRSNFFLSQGVTVQLLDLEGWRDLGVIEQIGMQGRRLGDVVDGEATLRLKGESIFNILGYIERGKFVERDYFCKVIHPVTLRYVGNGVNHTTHNVGITSATIHSHERLGGSAFLAVSYGQDLRENPDATRLQIPWFEGERFAG